jgi:hypothetical protein
MNRRTIVLLLALQSVVFPISFPAGLQPTMEVRQACAQEGWREEFDAICAKTDMAMTLSNAELTDLIGRCDQVKARIATEDDSTRRVYLRRLQMCQDLYRYVLRNR